MEKCTFFTTPVHNNLKGISPLISRFLKCRMSNKEAYSGSRFLKGQI